MKRHMVETLVGVLLIALFPGFATAKNRDKLAFTESFPLTECSFSAVGGNTYFPLTPNRQLYYNNQECVDAGDCDALVELTITVLDETLPVNFEVDGEPLNVTTRIVQEEELENGELTEISRNYFAECTGDGDVYYFGEDVDIFQADGSISHDGAWLSGVNGALPGIIMPGGAPLIGSRYYQEIAPDVALDRAEHVAVGLETDVPAGLFTGCVETLEDTPLEHKSESTKVYCRDVGLVIDDELVLVEIVHE